MGIGLEQTDVIAAIATPPGRGGVSIVRVSGPGLAQWGERLVGRPIVERRPMRVSFLDESRDVIDDGLILFFPGPQSYTGDDVLELHGHGGPVVSAMLLRRTLELGARPAGPGEFTRRAFLNGKLDLAQAEAVADVIDASTEVAARSALRSLRGDFSRLVHDLVDRLIHLRALCEATLDFPEEEIDPLDRADARDRLSALRTDLDATVVRGRQGSLLRSGIHVVLAGQPNVGKSSLLNCLAGEDVAIVTPIPGTTRDTIRSAIQLEGVPLSIVDTAGLRDSPDEIERLGMARTWREIEQADVLLLVLDARIGLGSEDQAILSLVPQRIPRVFVHNKIDLTGTAASRSRDEMGQHVFLSARTGAGIDLLRGSLLDVVGWQPGGEDVFVARERHLEALMRAQRHLAAASEVFVELELFAEELRLAQASLNAITGEFSADDLLGEIFGRFCIGK